MFCHSIILENIQPCKYISMAFKHNLKSGLCDVLSEYFLALERPRVMKLIGNDIVLCNQVETDILVLPSVIALWSPNLFFFKSSCGKELKRIKWSGKWIPEKSRVNLSEDIQSGFVTFYWLWMCGSGRWIMEQRSKAPNVTPRKLSEGGRET